MHYALFCYAKGIDTALCDMHNRGMITGEQIKAVRRRLGEKQAQFAEHFGVDQATVHRWEKKGISERGMTLLAVHNILKELENLAPAEAAE